MDSGIPWISWNVFPQIRGTPGLSKLSPWHAILSMVLMLHLFLDLLRLGVFSMTFHPPSPKHEGWCRTLTMVCCVMVSRFVLFRYEEIIWDTGQSKMPVIPAWVPEYQRNFASSFVKLTSNGRSFTLDCKWLAWNIRTGRKLRDQVSLPPRNVPSRHSARLG